jgi:hypothetical protein
LHVPLLPQLACTVAPHTPRGSFSPFVTVVHVPFAAPVSVAAHASHAPPQAALQQKPSTQNPLTQPAAAAHGAPLPPPPLDELAVLLELELELLLLAPLDELAVLVELELEVLLLALLDELAVLLELALLLLALDALVVLDELVVAVELAELALDVVAPPAPPDPLPLKSMSPPRIVKHPDALSVPPSSSVIPQRFIKSSLADQCDLAPTAESWLPSAACPSAP